MKPINFPEVNATFANDQQEYLPLLTWRERGQPEGRVVSCWQPTFWERLRVLFGSNIYLELLTFNDPLQPQKLYVGSPFVEVPDPASQHSQQPTLNSQLSPEGDNGR